MLWTGRVLSLWPVFVVVSSATWKLTRNQRYVTEFTRIGWPESPLPLLAFLQLGSLLLYVIPRTAVLGAVLLPVTSAAPSPPTCAWESLIQFWSRYQPA